MPVIKLLERAGNLVLSLDPETAALLPEFKGKEFCIVLESPRAPRASSPASPSPDLSIWLIPSADGFHLNTAPTKETADVTLCGSLLSFIKLAREGQHSDVFHSGRIRLQGDAELGKALQGVMLRLAIDWEEITAKIMGDFASQQLHRTLTGVKSWFDSSQRQFKQNLGEVLQEEWKFVPAAAEIEQFTAAVETLRADVDRIEARLQSLVSAAHGAENSPQ